MKQHLLDKLQRLVDRGKIDKTKIKIKEYKDKIK